VERDAIRDERLRQWEATPAPAALVTHQAVKAKDPRPYDGLDNRFAREFLTSCRIVFLAHPDQFAGDTAKVLYAGSFLTGTARTWFEPIVEDSDEESRNLRNNWNYFQEQFENLFSDPAEKDTAEQQLLELEMKNDHRISEYMTKFRRLVAKIGWSQDSVLKAHFRRGLAPRIKDKMASKGRQPETYQEMVTTALTLDTAYWRREEERRHERGGRDGRSDRKVNFSERDRKRDDDPNPKPFVRTTFQKTISESRNFGQRRQDHRGSRRGSYRGGSSGSFSSRSDNYSQRSTPLANSLKSDGTLKEDERQRRLAEGLCLYCEAKGHKLADCPKKPGSSSNRSNSGFSSGYRQGKA
jgi:hypothetical protein